jgi:hypothetical protein
MKGDFARGKVVPSKTFTSVVTQQGRVQTDADYNEQKELVRRYLLAHPDAEDTLEGISRWWLPAGAGQTATTQAALDALVADGVLVENIGPRGKTYRRRHSPS